MQTHANPPLPLSRRSAVAGPRDWDVSEKEFRRQQGGRTSLRIRPSVSAAAAVVVVVVVVVVVAVAVFVVLVVGVAVEGSSSSS